MTVGLTWANPGKAGEDGKPKKTPEEVAVQVATKRRRLTCGCLSTILGIACVAMGILAVMAYMTYWGVERKMRENKKNAKVHWNKKEPSTYDRPFHGRRPEDHDDWEGYYFQESPFWDQWYGLLDDSYYTIEPNDEVSVVNEWFMVDNGVWVVEVVPWLSMPVTIMTDSISDFTAVKADMRDGMGPRCMILHSDNLVNVLEPIEEFVEDNQRGQRKSCEELNIDHIVTEFWAIGQPVMDHHEVGEAIRGLCGDVENMHYLISVEDQFRAEVAGLMAQHDVTYDDMYYWFTDALDAYESGDVSGLDALMDSFDEIIGFMPDGRFDGHDGPNGMGWSLNVQTVPYTWEYDMTYFDFYATE